MHFLVVQCEAGVYARKDESQDRAQSRETEETERESPPQPCCPKLEKLGAHDRHQDAPGSRGASSAEAVILRKTSSRLRASPTSSWRTTFSRRRQLSDLWSRCIRYEQKVRLDSLSGFAGGTQRRLQVIRTRSPDSYGPGRAAC